MTLMALVLTFCVPTIASLWVLLWVAYQRTFTSPRSFIRQKMPEGLKHRLSTLTFRSVYGRRGADTSAAVATTQPAGVLEPLRGHLVHGCAW